MTRLKKEAKEYKSCKFLEGQMCTLSLRIISKHSWFKATTESGIKSSNYLIYVEFAEIHLTPKHIPYVSSRWI